MQRITRHIALALVTGGAFFAGLEGSAIAGDPDAADEAPPPGAAPTLAVWDREIRSARIDGVRVELVDGALAFTAGSDGEPFDYDVRCEKVMGSPMARIYVPPMTLSRTRVRGVLEGGEALRVALDLEAPEVPPRDAPPSPNAFDTIRVTISAHGAATDAEPLAVLQIPTTPPS